MDLETILHRNHEQMLNRPTMRQADVVPPTMGLLTQTVVPSPVINWIIPARIRHKEKNDILVIGVSCSFRSFRLATCLS